MYPTGAGPRPTIGRTDRTEGPERWIGQTDARIGVDGSDGPTDQMDGVDIGCDAPEQNEKAEWVLRGSGRLTEVLRGL